MESVGLVELSLEVEYDLFFIIIESTFQGLLVAVCKNTSQSSTLQLNEGDGRESYRVEWREGTKKFNVVF